MDLKLLDIFEEIGTNRVKQLIGRLPVSNHKQCNDLLSTELYGVLYDTKLSQETMTALQHFALQNIPSHATTKKKLKELLINTLKREKISHSIKNNPGLIMEYMLVDLLLRNKIPKKEMPSTIDLHNMTHTKGTHEQDEHKKTDFISSIGDKKHTLRIGVQATTTTQHQLTYEQAQKLCNTSMPSKKMKVYEISQHLNTHPNPTKLQQKYEPDLLSYLVINGGIDTVLNKEKDNFLATAYRDWENKGFPHGGPTTFIRKDMKELLLLVAKYYQMSLGRFRIFMSKLIQDPAMSYQKNITETPTSSETSIETYKANSSELVHEFFVQTSTNSEKQLLFSISYFINDNTKKIFEDQ